MITHWTSSCQQLGLKHIFWSHLDGSSQKGGRWKEAKCSPKWREQQADSKHVSSGCAGPPPVPEREGRVEDHPRLSVWACWATTCFGTGLLWCLSFLPFTLGSSKDILTGAKCGQQHPEWCLLRPSETASCGLDLGILKFKLGSSQVMRKISSGAPRGTLSQPTTSMRTTSFHFHSSLGVLSGLTVLCFYKVLLSCEGWGFQSQTIIDLKFISLSLFLADK